MPVTLSMKPPKDVRRSPLLRTNQPIDIILSDINMPGMDGIELSNCVGAEWPQLPILLISGRPPPAGVRAFIAKPFRWDALANAIENLAGSGRH